MPDEPTDSAQDPSLTGPADERGPAGDVSADVPADVPADGSARAVDAVYDAALDTMTGLLREQARGWGRQLRVLLQLDALAERGGAGRAAFASLEMAGSWQVSQLTATRWQQEAHRFDEALPRTLAMLEAGHLLVHQASVLLHRTRHCTVEVARAVEEQVLPAGAALCPADLTRRVTRAVLRIEAELDAAAAGQRHADAAAQRRTFSRPEPDGMGLAGAVVTAEQLAAWQAALDQLEKRERQADRHAGVVRTVEQRKADLFAALPAMVLAGTAQDRTALAELARAGLAVPGVSAPFTTGPYTSGPFPPGPSGTGPDRAGAPSAEDVAAAAAMIGRSRAAGSGVAAPAACPALVPWTLGPEQLAAHVVLNVLVPVATVLDLSRAPGTIQGYGPVSAEHIRLLRPRSWRRVLVDSTSGRPIAVDDQLTPASPEPHTARQQVQQMLRPDVAVDTDEPQHDPSTRLARLVDIRDVHCCGPGCSSTVTDRDHGEPWPHGPTSATNLTRLLSRRCHRAKHSGWHLQRHPDGSVTWTSPLGRTYHRPSPHEPPPHVDLHTDPLARDGTAARPQDEPRWLTPDDLTGPHDQAAQAGEAGDEEGLDQAGRACDGEDGEPPPF